MYFYKASFVKITFKFRETKSLKLLVVLDVCSRFVWRLTHHWRWLTVAFRMWGWWKKISTWERKTRKSPWWVDISYCYLRMWWSRKSPGEVFWGGPLILFLGPQELAHRIMYWSQQWRNESWILAGHGEE